MKISILILLLSTAIVKGQIFTQSSANGSIIITPKGVQGNSNLLGDTTNVALGPSALFNNMNGNYIQRLVLGLFKQLREVLITQLMVIKPFQTTHKDMLTRPTEHFHFTAIYMGVITRPMDIRLFITTQEGLLTRPTALRRFIIMWMGVETRL